MNVIHRQHLPPSGVEFSCQASLTPSTLKSSSNVILSSTSRPKPITNLVLARSTILQLFELCIVENTDSSGSSQQNYDHKVYKLFHVCEHRLHGRVTGIQRITTLESQEDGLDRLLVSFQDAKMSLLEWSNSAQDLVPISLHTFEKLPQITQGDLPRDFQPHLETDPLSRCAVLLLPQATLAVLPFFQDQLDLDGLGLGGGLNNAFGSDQQRLQTLPYASSFIIDFNQQILNHLSSTSSEIHPQHAIKSVTALKFLPGFSEPTLAVLYQTQYTWSARLENHTNTAALIVLTLDLGSNHFPIISHTQNLPYDAHGLVACPKELTGVLILCADAILHVDQSSKIIGVATNGWIKHTSELQVPRQETVHLITSSTHMSHFTSSNPTEPLSEDLEDGEAHVKRSTPPKGCEKLLIRLDNSKIVFCKLDLALMFLRNGQVFSLQFERDGRTLTQLTLQKFNVRSIIPSTVIKLCDGCLFVGSMCGDSALYAIDEIQDLSSKDDSKESSTQPKFVKTNTNLDMDEDIYGERMDIQNVNSNDQSQLYDMTQRSWVDDRTKRGANQVPFFFLRLCDVIQAHGPIRDFTMASTGSDENMPLELLACTGADDSGGLTLFHREMPLRKRRKLEFNGSPYSHVKTLFSTSVLAENSGTLEEKELIWIVKSNHQTDVATRGELDEIVLVTTLPDESLAVSPFFDRKFIVQVTNTAIKLFTAGLDEVQVVQPEPSVKIRHASVTDNYVLLDTYGGSKVLYQGDFESKALKKIPAPFNDHGVHHASILKAALPIYKTIQPTGTSPIISKPLDSHDGEHFLYSDQVSLQQKDSSGDFKMRSPNSCEGVLNHASITEECTEKCWLLTTATDGSFHIRTLPSLDIVFTATRIDILPETISDDDKLENESHPVEFFGSVDEPIPTQPIAHIFTFLTGATISRPHLAVTLKNGAFAVYEILTSYEVPIRLPEKQGHPAVLLKKVIAHQFEGLDESDDGLLTLAHNNGIHQMDNTDNNMNSPLWSVTPFKKNKKFKGAFLSSKPQVWLLSTDHGSCRIYNSAGENTINGITQLTSNENLIISHQYLDQKPNSQPPPILTPNHHHHKPENHSTSDAPFQIFETFISDFICFDREIPTCLVKTGRCFNKVVYDSFSQTIVGASYLETAFANFDEEGNLMWEPDDDSLIRPTTFRSALELILPGSWVTIDGYEFQQNEWVTSMANVDLDSRSTISGRRQFIGVGTTCNRAEDLASRGGIYVFEVIQVNPFSEKHPEHNRSLRLHYYEETKACVSAVDAINGYFLHTMGQKLYAKCFEQDERLLAVGFLDIKPYGTCLRVFKNLILLGDAVKGVTLVAFQEEPYKLIELGHTYVDLKCSTVDFLVIDAKLAIVATDLNGVIRIFEYNPTNIESQAGQKLLCRTEFNATSEISCSMQFGRRLSETEEAKTMGTLFASFDGSISSLVPAKEAVSKRLQLVQTRLTRHVQHFAGLNPKGHRTVRNDLISRAINRGILDGELLNKFELLSISQQAEIAGLAGSDRETILVNLSNLRNLW